MLAKVSTWTLNDGCTWAASAESESAINLLGTFISSGSTTLDGNVTTDTLMQLNSTDSTPSTLTIGGDLTASGATIDLANGVAGDKMVISGNYTTQNNTWLMDSYLTGTGQSTDNGSDGKSYTDTVEIKGNVTGSGYDQVWINNLNINNPTGQ